VESCAQPGAIGTRADLSGLEKVNGKARTSLGALPDTLIEQAEQGVGLLHIHAGLLLRHVRSRQARDGICRAADRSWPKWCSPPRESFLYTHFEDICEI